MTATAFKPSAEMLDRWTAVSSVLASFRMEGMEPDDATAAILDQYVAGLLTLDEFGVAIESYVARMGMKKAAAAGAA